MSCRPIIKRPRGGLQSLFATILLLITTAVGAAPDHRLFASLLKKYVHDGVVDYSGFKQDEEILNDYLEALSRIQPEELSRDDKFAFYTNAYNAWTIKLILTGYPGVKSIKDLGSLLKSPWKKKISRINDELLTLDEIEHDILRPQFKDPRVHFAVNCASKGCPPLQSDPFEGALLDRQLESATRTFINDPKRYQLKGNTLYVSKIFKWFPEDFNDGVKAFFMKYAEDDLKKKLQSVSDKLKIKYLDYDWDLNGK